MALRNPTIDPPHLPSPTKRSLASRSPSRSPTRRYQSVRHFDPLLRDLSPTATLRAFSSQPDELQSHHLGKCTQNASHAERALGTKAAQSCLNLRSWVRELEAWEWPGTFDIPEPARKKQRTSALSIGSLISRPSLSQNDDEAIPEYWGSLPSETAKAYQRRVDEVSESLDDIDMEELKDFVLSAHSQAGYGEASIDDSIGAIGADTNLKHLDDFTAIVTATILQSLPYLSRLNRVLNSWSIRLSVLRAAPAYLRDLGQARTDLDHGWAALAVSSHPAAADALQKANATFSRDTMLEMKTVVENQVYSLGRRLDAILDALEGRTDCVPDRWIEDFEGLEEQYGDWVVQAERKVLEGEWRDYPAHADEREAATGMEVVLNGEPTNSRDLVESPQSQTDRFVTVGPTTVTSTTAAGGRDATMHTTTHTTSSGPRTTVVSTTTPISSTTTHTSVEESVTSSNRSSNVPSASSATPSPRTQRHIPNIPEGYTGDSIVDGSRYIPTNDAADASLETSNAPLRPSLKSSNSNDAAASVKKRAAFLNSDIEKTDRLNKSKPAPIVRPFEHASNAFTRLFKREKEKESDGSTSRSSSVSSRGKRGDQKVASVSATEARSKMGYPDLFAVPITQPAEDTSRTASVRESRPRTPNKADPRVMEYVDMVRVPERTSSDRQRSNSRPKTPKYGSPTAAEGSGRPRSASNPSKRSSKQNITALPAMGAAEPPVPVILAGKGGPDTYLPTGLTSPFHSPIEPEPGYDVPDNWPLSNEVTPVMEAEDPMGGGKEATRRDASAQRSDDAMPTDTFEDKFVNSIDHTPQRPITSGVNAAGEKETRFGGPIPSSPSTPLRTSVEEGVFYQERPPPDRSLLRTGRSSQNVRLGDELETTLPRPVSVVVEADEEDSAAALDMDGSVTRRDGDNAAAYFGGSASASSAAPPSSSKKPLPLPLALQRSKSTPPVSPMMLRLRIPPDSPEDSKPSEIVDEDGGTGLIRRASTTSIEAFPRSKVRSIEVVRRNSTDSPRSLPQTPQEASRPSVEKGRATVERNEPASPLHYKGNVYFPSPPVSPNAVPPRGSSLRSSSELRRSVDGRRSIQADDLGTRISKSRQEQPASPSTTNVPLRRGEDNFDRHVSEVLDRVHANIKFRTRPGAETPSSQLRVGGKLPKAAERSSKNMTLAPAESSPRKATPADPDIKLYHLTQAGRSEPIKLYVRLVGEGNSERVMVRVGGGWADLADYLRQYAEHHGSRTVSEGGLQLQTAASSTTAASGAGLGKRTFSGPASSEPKARGTPITPVSALPRLDRPGSKDSERRWLDQEQPTFTMGDSDDSASPSPVVARQAQDAGSGTPSTNSSRPSTAHAAGQSESPQTTGPTSALRQVESAENSPAGSLSMAGPGSSSRMKADLPEQKARWVEGMIERVNKSASAEKTRAFADIGKVGGTRRIAFRKGSAGAGT